MLLTLKSHPWQGSTWVIRMIEQKLVGFLVKSQRLNISKGVRFSRPLLFTKTIICLGRVSLILLENYTFMMEATIWYFSFASFREFTTIGDTISSK